MGQIDGCEKTCAKAARPVADGNDDDGRWKILPINCWPKGAASPRVRAQKHGQIQTNWSELGVGRMHVRDETA